MGGFHVAAVVMVVSGATKVASPDAFDALLRSLVGGPARRVRGGVGRFVGALEVLLGVVAVVLGSTSAAAAVAVAYVCFAVVVVVARRRGVESCGCFGEAAAPPSTVHVVIDLAGAGFAAMAAIDPPGSLGAVLTDQPWGGVPYLFAVGLASWFAVLVATRGAEVAALVTAADLRRAESSNGRGPGRSR